MMDSMSLTSREPPTRQQPAWQTRRIPSRKFSPLFGSTSQTCALKVEPVRSCVLLKESSLLAAPHGESGRWQERARNAATPPGGPRPAVIPAALHRGLIGCFPLLLLSSSVQACVSWFCLLLAGCWLASWPGHLSLAARLSDTRYRHVPCMAPPTTTTAVSLHITKYQTKKHHPHRPRKGPQTPPPPIPPRNRMTPRPRLPPASPGVPPVTTIFGAEGLMIRHCRRRCSRVLPGIPGLRRRTRKRLTPIP